MIHILFKAKRSIRLLKQKQKNNTKDSTWSPMPILVSGTPEQTGSGALWYGRSYQLIENQYKVKSLVFARICQAPLQLFFSFSFRKEIMKVFTFSEFGTK